MSYRRIVQGTVQSPKVVLVVGDVNEKPPAICCPDAGDPVPWCTEYSPVDARRCEHCPVKVVHHARNTGQWRQVCAECQAGPCETRTRGKMLVCGLEPVCPYFGSMSKPKWSAPEEYPTQDVAQWGPEPEQDEDDGEQLVKEEKDDE